MKSYVIHGMDNGKYAYDKKSASRCKECGAVSRTSKRNTLKKLKYDISCTYENELLVSEKVYLPLKNHIDCSILEKIENYYYVLPTQALEVDKSNLQFGQICKECGKPSHVIGAYPCILKKEVEKSGIYRTELEYGDIEGYSSILSPLVIITEDILEIILKVNPTGIEYEETLVV